MRFLFLLLFTASAHAQIIKLQPVYVLTAGKSTMNAASYYHMLDDSVTTFRGVGILIKRLGVKVIEDPCPQYSSLDTQTSKLYCLGIVGRKLGLIKNRQITHFTLPLAFDGSGNRYIAGLARKTCGLKYGRFAYLYSYSMANAGDVSQSGQARYNHSLTAMIHENAHALGAEHDDSNPNLMHSAANQFTDKYWPLGFNALAIEQMRRCIK